MSAETRITAITRTTKDASSRALECGDLSPLSAGDLSPSDVETHPPSSQPPEHSLAGPTSQSGGESGDKSPHSKPWPHAPVHKLTEHGVYLVTAGTLHKERLFTCPEKLSILERQLLELANRYHWQLEAWAVFANHYHFVARGNPESADLGKFVKHLHANSSRELNRLDQSEGRKVWHNFWDTRLTFAKSYLARLNYVHQNAVKHGLVPVANQYPWCSSAWFERVATPAMVQTIYRFKTDEVKVEDDF
ncbi:MAG: transposase [Verrucomicrobia bacterium]|nr:transposase [Verrucomicrobiota bacterium]